MDARYTTFCPDGNKKRRAALADGAAPGQAGTAYWFCRNVLSLSERDGWRSLLIAFASI